MIHKMGNNLAISSKPAVLAITVGFLSFSSSLAAFYFFYRINRATRLDNLRETNYNIEHLNTAIDILRKEIEELKAAKSLQVHSNNGTEEDTKSAKFQKVVRFKSSLSYLSSSSDALEYQSAWSDNEGSSVEEFFDFPENDIMGHENLDNSSSVPEEAIELFDKVDNWFEGCSADHELAFKLLSTYKNEFKDNAEFLWRIAKSYRIMAQSSNDPSRQKELSYEAVEFARRSLAADESNAEAHKWFAISLGATSCYVSVSEKIRSGALFKHHIDKAIKINPSDYLLHHLLGRFNFEVSTLSWIERKVAAALFQNMPSSSIEEALSYFISADRLRMQPWKINDLYIARCYIQLGEYTKAIEFIERAVPITVMTIEDQTSHDELLTLLSRYNTYSSKTAKS